MVDRLFTSNFKESFRLFYVSEGFKYEEQDFIGILPQGSDAVGDSLWSR